MISSGNWLSLLLCCWGCCGHETEDMMANRLTKAQITTLLTTPHVLGSFAGNQQPNLQINELEPGEYTLQFQLVQPTIDGLGQATYAIIRWKVQGQQLQRIVSVYSGAVISGVAEAVDVQLLDQSGRGFITFVPLAAVTNGSTLVVLTGPVTLADGELLVFSAQPNASYAVSQSVPNATTIQLALPYLGPTTPATNFYALAPYKVGVVLSKGTRPTIMQPPVLFTQPSILRLLPSTLSAIPIPQDAGVISVLTTVIVSGVAVAQAEAANGVVKFKGLTSAALNISEYVPQTFPGWFPVPVGTSVMNLFNNSTTATLDFSIQWGIEG